VSAYQQGAELSPHIDRKQCEYTFSVIIDESGGRSADWPLWFLIEAQPTAVILNVGEGVLFRGHELPHWREAAPQSALALSTLLLHYVPVHFRDTLS
jgi:alkylated DNA repair dioxygenase AlkB